MKRTNLVNKSVKLLMSVIIASSVVAMGSNGTVAATLTNNDAIISSIVMAAETTPLPKQWSTAEVYKDARYGDTWGGPAGDYGTQTRWEWLNDMNYVFTVEHATTENGTVLDYQYLIPIDVVGGDNEDTYIAHTDNNEPIRKRFIVNIGANVEKESEHLWYYTKDQMQAVAVNKDGGDCEIPGALYYDAVDEGDYYRVTLNKAFVATNGKIYTGYVSYVELKATGQIYRFEYVESIDAFDAARALTVIYSCLPIVQK